jgi:hypothetical protein
MAVFSLVEKEAIKQKILSHSDQWILLGISKKSKNWETMNGVVGVADWLLHGQVSKQLERSNLKSGELMWISTPGNRSNFLFYYFEDQPESKEFFKKLAGIEIKNLVIAETSFPEDFCTKLKQYFKKENIPFSSLE